jgi:hypothetical protein
VVAIVALAPLQAVAIEWGDTGVPLCDTNFTPECTHPDVRSRPVQCLDSDIKILGLLLPFGWLVTRWSVLAIRFTKRRSAQEPGNAIYKVHYVFTWMIVCVMSIIFMVLLVFLLGV